MSRPQQSVNAVAEFLRNPLGFGQAQQVQGRESKFINPDLDHVQPRTLRIQELSSNPNELWIAQQRGGPRVQSRFSLGPRSGAPPRRGAFRSDRHQPVGKRGSASRRADDFNFSRRRVPARNAVQRGARPHKVSANFRSA